MPGRSYCHSPGVGGLLRRQTLDQVNLVDPATLSRSTKSSTLVSSTASTELEAAKAFIAYLYLSEEVNHGHAGKQACMQSVLVNAHVARNRRLCPPRRTCPN